MYNIAFIIMKNIAFIIMKKILLHVFKCSEGNPANLNFYSDSRFNKYSLNGQWGRGHLGGRIGHSKCVLIEKG